MVGPEYTTIHIKAGGADGSWTNVFDVYKTKGTCVVEHWDCLQAMDNKTVSSHPYF
jgi:predicted SnoaL-like aldol condensation-catalyzing enzyme